MITCTVSTAVDQLCQTFIEGFHDQCGFTTPTDTCHTGDLSQWKINIDIFQVIFTRAFDGQEFACTLSAYLWQLNAESTCQVGSGETVFYLLHFFRRSGSNHMTAMFTSTRSEVNQPIG
jgi:hypothetical protein